MTWRAVFADGPLAADDVERIMVAAEMPDELYFVKLGPPHGWVLVGASGIEPDPPWPGQVHYRLRERSIAPSDALGDDQGLATYALADDANPHNPTEDP